MTNTPTDLRLQLLNNGYSPIPNRDKRCFLKRWPAVAIDPDTIEAWGRRRRFPATGLRVENGLAVIDIDIDHEVINAVIGAVEELAGDYLLRTGAGYKEAWFVRTGELFSRIHSRRWLAPGAALDDGTACVEIFGGASPRQFGAFGPHTITDDDEVRVSYTWDGPSPETVPLDALPVLDKKTFYEIVDRTERILQDAGFTPVVASSRGESDAQRVYDLTDDHLFDLDNGMDAVPLRQLRAVAESEDALRCSASWLEGPTAKNRSRCLVTLARNGSVAIWESATGVTHMEASKTPINRQIDIDRAMEKLKELEDRQRHKFDVDDDVYTTCAKLRHTYAFCPTARASVVPLWATDAAQCMTNTAFRQFMLPWSQTEIGPRGGEKRINPADLWLCDGKRVSVRGLQMRPDQPRPTFEEDGEVWVNVYDPPVFDAVGGRPDEGVEFIERLLPDARERDWFLKWLAFKFMNPHIPGPGVVMVAAATFGTGRGTLGLLLEKLFGEQYVRSVPFHIFAGQSYQSQYNDWLVSSVIILVNESSSTENGASAYRTKANAYEHIKEVVEPRQRRVHVVQKSEQSYRSWAFASCIIATNHRDAAPIPQGDRRLAVLTNGPPAEPEFWERLNRWLENDANIAAFADWLKSYDIAGYSPFEPPIMTAAKQTMIDLGSSEIDQAFNMLIEQAPGALFTADQVAQWLRALRDAHGFDYPEGWPVVAKRLTQNRLTRVGERGGRNWLVPVGDTQRLPVFARDSADADKWTVASPADVRAELDKNNVKGKEPGAILSGVFSAKV